ncbi:hypothetical protein AVEN_97316-1 [Araneus ventricosus]|uniref:Tc1-like transposase DDE domain-containing protein n=1 Tax=Araneus ventricosus TaxID=182803 RepID=A0A4Y2HQ13_ARAVE|nr:hypothetical protein AVEN_97316-1 [Araneus ventricosus]
MSIVHSDEFGQSKQDSATPHTSRVSTKCLQEHSSHFRHFHCPPKSPDMNIIDLIWVALQCAVQISWRSEISTTWHSYGFADCPAGFMV